MPAGGYQKPANPAPVSGPGAGSKRTDGGPAQKLRSLPDAQYGEAATFRSLQDQAPLAQTPTTVAPSRGASGGGGSGAGMGFGDPSMRPEEPVTTGLGKGGEGMSLDPQIETEDLDRLKRYLPAMIEMAGRPESTPGFRNYVRLLRSKVG